jgi:hypothetical protein
MFLGTIAIPRILGWKRGEGVVVKSFGQFLSHQGEGQPKRHGLIVGANALAMYLGLVIFLVAFPFLVLGFVRVDESLVKPAFIASVVGTFLYFFTYQRYFHYRQK